MPALRSDVNPSIRGSLEGMANVVGLGGVMIHYSTDLWGERAPLINRTVLIAMLGAAASAGTQEHALTTTAGLTLPAAHVKAVTLGGRQAVELMLATRDTGQVDAMAAEVRAKSAATRRRVRQVVFGAPLVADAKPNETGGAFEADGLVTFIPHRGAVVASCSLARYQNCSSFAPLSNRMYFGMPRPR